MFIMGTFEVQKKKSKRRDAEDDGEDVHSSPHLSLFLSALLVSSSLECSPDDTGRGGKEKLFTLRFVSPSTAVPFLSEAEQQFHVSKSDALVRLCPPSLGRVRMRLGAS